MIISKELIIKFRENYNKSFEIILSADALINVEWDCGWSNCSEHGAKCYGDNVKPSEGRQTQIRMKNGRRV